jgi:hypothetical protein
MAGAHLLDLGVQALAHLQAARNEDHTAIEEDGHRGCDGRRSAIKPARGRQVSGGCMWIFSGSGPPLS